MIIWLSFITFKFINPITYYLINKKLLNIENSINYANVICNFF